MRRLIVYGYLVLAMVVAYALFAYADGEMPALNWHLRHGFHTQVADTRLSVPFAYEASDPGLPSISLTRLPGLLWLEGGFIDIDFERLLPLPEDIEAAEALLKEKGFHSVLKRVRVGERKAIYAGRQGRCVEYNVALNDSHNEGYEIGCQFDGDVRMRFLGSRKLTNDFYSIIASAQPIKAKRQ